ncbi:bifunctional protein-serine/threonine kinase/phosphatase [Aliidiomarina sanyensis]|uniref:Serine/threonine protein kinase n=1 Tax=Aliidiomarina sanyensis TaxID=1249555 RepID=A0A432WRK2_9GAMM|nr:bifunctional protein-serine/threonine kinase/phosphatase [Aliidiomarina sanyensis]RUO36391.1 serine/threonine protein kinase [Aliidiomarina sanyensis]
MNGIPSAEHLVVGHASLCDEGGKDGNEDAVGVRVPVDAHMLTYKGAVFAVADGVTSAEAGQDASETAIRTFLRDYFSTPDTWSVAHSASQVLSTINLRLYRHSHQFNNEMKGQLCTFSALVLKSHTAHFFHVGDTRIYHWRSGFLRLLTTDHSAQLNPERRFLARALGMDGRLQLDHGKQDITSGDRFLLTSDGLHDYVQDSQMQEVLSQISDPKAVCEELRRLAMMQGCDDNISVIVVTVEQLPNIDIDDFHDQLTRLPFPPALKAGMKVDGLEVIQEIFASSRSHLYLVRDLDSGQRAVMKTPSANYEDDSSYIERFIREEWIGSRVDSPHVVKIIRQSRPRSFLYYLMEYVDGISMEQWLTQNYPVKPARAIKLIEQIALGVKAFHDCEAVHQDLKPGNIIITTDPVSQKESIKIVDFGSVFVAGVAEVFIPIEHEAVLGTASYSDPQYLTGRNSGIQGDVYALATICYELFTGSLPYGEKIEACQTPSDYDRLRYISARKHNPAIPVWFDRALEKGVSFDLQQRYTTMEALLTDLKNPNPAFLREEVKQNTRSSSLLFWQLLSGFWFVTLLLVIYLFVLNQT